MALGQMYNEDSSSTVLTNVTFSGNSADWSGGGMYNGNSSLTLTNCILWGNTAPYGAQIFNDDPSHPAVTYSDVQGGYGGTGNIDADPRFADADGRDGVAGTLDDNLRLQLTSPAIDAGDNSAVPPDAFDLDGDGDRMEKLPYDLGRYPRRVDIPNIPDTGVGPTPIVDMGAHETQLSVYLPLLAKGFAP